MDFFMNHIYNYSPSLLFSRNADSTFSQGLALTKNFVQKNILIISSIAIVALAAILYLYKRFSFRNSTPKPAKVIRNKTPIVKHRLPKPIPHPSPEPATHDKLNKLKKLNTSPTTPPPLPKPLLNPQPRSAPQLLPPSQPFFYSQPQVNQPSNWNTALIPLPANPLNPYLKYSLYHLEQEFQKLTKILEKKNQYLTQASNKSLKNDIIQNSQKPLKNDLIQNSQISLKNDLIQNSQLSIEDTQNKIEMILNIYPFIWAQSVKDLFPGKNTKVKQFFFGHLVTMYGMMAQFGHDKHFVYNCLKQIHLFLAKSCFTSETELCLAEGKKADYMCFHIFMQIVNHHYKFLEKKDPELAINLKLKLANVPLKDKEVVVKDRDTQEITKFSVPIDRAELYPHLHLTEKEQLNILYNHFQKEEDKHVSAIISDLPAIKNLTYKDLLRLSKMTSKEEGFASEGNRLSLRKALIKRMGNKAPVWNDADKKDDKLICIELSKFFNKSIPMDILIKYFEEGKEKTIKKEDQFVAAVIANLPFIKYLKESDALKLSKILADGESLLSSTNRLNLQKAFKKDGQCFIGWKNAHFQDRDKIHLELTSIFNKAPQEMNDNPAIEYAHRASDARDFFAKQEGLSEEEIQIPRWYHTTWYENMKPIIKKTGEIQVRKKKTHIGAWVSTQIEGGKFGDCVLVMNNGLSKLDPDVFIGFQDLNSKVGKKEKNMRWRGLQVAIPLINPKTNLPYVNMVGVDTDVSLHPNARKKILKYLKSRGINNIRIDSFAQLKYLQKEVIKIIGNPNLSENWWGKADVSYLDKAND